jgi:hypothetical protein
MKRIVVLACAGLALGMSSPLAAEQTVPPATQPEQLPPAPPPPPEPNARHRWVDIDGSSSSRASHRARPARHAAPAKVDGKSLASIKSSKGAKSSKGDKASKGAKGDKASKHAKAGKSAKGGKSAKASKSAKGGKSAKTGKSAKLGKHAKAEKVSHSSKLSRANASHRTERKEKATQFSAKTVRLCHAMSYRQIMRSSTCRTMIKQELSETPRKDRGTHGKPAVKKAASSIAKHKAATKTTTRHSSAKRSKR